MIFLKKSLGQNFLIDKNIIHKIINLTNIYDKNVIEIGPGNGALTDEILKKKPKSLIVIEKDNNLSNKLEEKYKNIKNIKIYNADVLSVNLEKITLKNSTIIGNLPYNISSQIYLKFLRYKNWPPKFDNLILMFQKELGEKIIGKFSTKDYGRLSILTNLKFTLMKKFIVSPYCFIPKPKVQSLVIHLRPSEKNKIFKIKKIENLEKVTNILFSNKRKMINKNIKKILNEKKINKIKNLNLKHRPSEISPEVYYSIASLYEIS